MGYQRKQRTSLMIDGILFLFFFIILKSCFLLFLSSSSYLGNELVDWLVDNLIGALFLCIYVYVNRKEVMF